MESHDDDNMPPISFLDKKRRSKEIGANHPSRQPTDEEPSDGNNNVRAVDRVLELLRKDPTMRDPNPKTTHREVTKIHPIRKK